ncbi:MAG: alpha/beta fold hydrolase [Actinomycetota bacterium]|nr:alpha/beta fold hydrolase [Actinomycetota bacterium]
MPPITSNTVLPARRTAVTLHTTDGLALEGELALPAERAPVATLVCLHPLPTEGGSMDSHLLRKAAQRLPALAGLAVLRFNTRGTRGSEGSFDDGGAERFDLAAALDLVESEELPSPWLVGWSFGSELVLRYGHEDATVVGGILLAPPLHRAGADALAAWAADGKPLVAIVPELDDYLRPPEAIERFAAVPQSRVVEIKGSKHLFVGAKYADRALSELVRCAAPDALPLSLSWPPE